jgi:tetratricopeptide (TPR) repeat protein
LQGIAQMLYGATLVFAGQLAEGAAASAEAARLARAVGDAWLLTIALSNAAGAYFLQGDMADAERLSGEAIAVGEQVGDPNHLAAVLCTAATMAFITGDWRRVHALLEQAQGVVQAMPLAQYSLLPLATWGRQWLVEGDHERGSATLDEVLSRGAQQSDPQVLLFVEQTLAERDLLQGEPEQARTRLEPYRRYLNQVDGDIAWLLPWALVEGGEIEQANEMLASTVTDAHAQGLRVRLADVLRVQALAEVQVGQYEAGATTLEQALVHARALPYPYAEAKALWAYGRLELARGHRREACERFEQALVICDRLGEHLYRSQIERALAEMTE